LYAIRRQTSHEKISSQTFRADVEMGNCLEFWSVAYLGLDDELFSDELGWDYFSDSVIDHLHDRRSLLIQQSREL
jgi:hypothetical protein